VRLPVLVAIGDGVALLAWLNLVPMVAMNQVGLMNARQARVEAERRDHASRGQR
jgi:hypothetical protein